MSPSRYLILLLALVLGGSLSQANGQSWTVTSAPITNWVSVACSADGTKVIAVAGWSIYLSTNSGATWTAKTTPSGPWIAVCSSGDGNRLIAAEDDDFVQLAIYCSTNAGSDWFLANDQGYTRGLACSLDGRNVVRVESPRAAENPDTGLIYTSTNGGVDWVSTSAPLQRWQAVTCSANGANVFAGAYGSAAGGGPIYSSTNFGVSWIQTTAPAKYWISMASSANGNILVAAAHYDGAGSSSAGSIYVSADAGLSWHSSSPVAYWSGVASSADGMKLVAVAGSYPSDDFVGPIYTSNDAGVTWISNSAPVLRWSAVASSADGTTRFAAVYGGGIYTWHAPPRPGTILWTYDAGSPISSTPSLAPDGTVVFGTYAGLNAVTNAGSAASNKWFFPTGAGWNGNDTSAIGSDGTIYFGSGDGHLYAVSPAGSQLWSFAFHSLPPTGPAIGADGTVYVEGDGILYALSSAGGALKWAYTNYGNGFPNSPTVGPDGTIYTGAGYTLFANAPDGRLKWSSSIPVLHYSMGDTPAIGSDGTIYVTCNNLLAFSPAGTNLWIGGGTANLNGSPSLGADGTIYVANLDTLSLSAISADGQVLKWTVLSSISNATTTAAIDAAGTIYYCAANSLNALNSNGTIAWSVTEPGPPLLAQTSPTIGPDGTIYAALGSTLYAVASGTNSPARSSWPMYRQNARHTGKIERPFLAPPQRQTDSNFTFQLYPNQLGLTYSVEASTNLNTWTTLTNVLATALPTVVMDLSASNAPTKFYRASLSNQ